LGDDVVYMRTYKHHIFASTAGARCSIPQTLHGDRARQFH